MNNNFIKIPRTTSEQTLQHSLPRRRDFLFSSVLFTASANSVVTEW